MERFRMAIQGAIEGWRGTAPQQRTVGELQAGYLEKWSLYDGTLFQRLIDANPYKSDPTVYRNTKLLWKHAEAVGDFYAGVIYQGALATTPPEEGNELGGAIPIVAQTGDDTRNLEVLRAVTEFFIAWNWQQQMSLRPLYGSVLGDCLTELVDDSRRRFVYPQIVWPGHVSEIELDYVGNVRRYVLEYAASEKRDGTIETFRFRKEVDKEAFRYFRDDKPYDAHGDGPVVPNVYGFVPAVWDRHRIGAPNSVRGRAALDGTRQALIQVNSMFSHAFDFQRKAFFAPVMIAAKGGSHAAAGTIDTTKKDEDAEASEYDIVPVPDGSQILQAQFDIGKTREMLQDIQQGILEENPEARFYQQLREMSQVTAPGAERLMGDVKTRVDLARGGYDANTVKIKQMSIAIAGYRVNNKDWSTVDGRRVPLTARQMAFARFDLQSYERGELDFYIKSRPIVPMSEAEKLEIIAQKEALMTPWGLAQAGLDEDDAKAVMDARTIADAGVM